MGSVANDFGQFLPKVGRLLERHLPEDIEFVLLFIKTDGSGESAHFSSLHPSIEAKCVRELVGLLEKKAAEMN